jgi:hypothetical protein
VGRSKTNYQPKSLMQAHMDQFFVAEVTVSKKGKLI